ncbi:hypothetical protein [Dyella acidiphila]|uniref:Uncharacterized protein n=1 Tax=Dyella acidiphila TaxID=2775866 RepID=A0ABR9GF96_9GAMM|nr:hypothetical protein [Dyella acidiphila]MBE1162723.1 hypothetical protein [Dyella acidiphila]
MSSNRITPSSSLLETLRTLARSRAQDVQGGKSAGNTTTAQRHQVTAQHDVQVLRQRLRELADGTDLSDAQALQQTRNHLLREILLWEFGSDFRNDPQFLPMIDSIGKTFDADPALQQRFADLIADLRKS